MDINELSPQELYFNRELSLLAFNHRVLEQAKDTSVPLLERLKFLCISSSNLDEFFEIRVGGLKQHAELVPILTTPDQLAPQEALKNIGHAAHELVGQQYQTLNDILIPALEQQGIRFLRRDEWIPSVQDWLKHFFQEELLPVLTPMGLDPSHPFPRVLNKSLNFIISLHGKDAFGRTSRAAVLQAPRSLPRVIHIPENIANSPHDFVFLSSIIHHYVSELFPGMDVSGCYQFRVTRNSDLFVDEEEIDDLLRALKGELSSRKYGEAVRLEVADNCPNEIAEFLLQEFNLESNDLYQVNGPVNLHRLMAVPALIENRPDLKYQAFTPKIPEYIAQTKNMFDAISQGDILLHHPFESFTPVIDLVQQAAKDPNVLAIKQTLYRSGVDSILVKALIKAAKAGKEVTAIIELKARFDEEANIKLATLLQEVGAHVAYGVVRHKTHAKMLMVVRREGQKLLRYVHLGTGNYHAGTARLYTDYGLLTKNPDIGEDVHNIFLQLTGLGRASRLHKLLQSPFTLHDRMLEKINRETHHAQQGNPARIILKMNSLVEAKTIQALYQASQAGVKVDLIIRGICCLKPGIKGLSDNIQVRSIIGRFLEHTRVFYFENNSHHEIYAGSADWMNRNFFQRVETCFPIENPRLKRRMIKECLFNYLEDNQQAWRLQSDGNYQRITATDPEQPPVSAQMALLKALAT